MYVKKCSVNSQSIHYINNTPCILTLPEHSKNLKCKESWTPIHSLTSTITSTNECSTLWHCHWVYKKECTCRSWQNLKFNCNNEQLFILKDTRAYSSSCIHHVPTSLSELSSSTWQKHECIIFSGHCITMYHYYVR